MDDSKYPQHERLAEFKERSQAIGEFLDYGPYTLHEWREDLTDTSSCDHYITKGFKSIQHTPSECPRCGGEGHYTFTVRDRFMPVTKSIEHILADYFEIDHDELMAEKDRMLHAIRSATNA